MDEYKIEDTVVLIDCSRSMIRTDFKPRRLIVALKTIKNFITTKLSFDPKDQIMLISYGNRTKKLSPFSNEEKTLLESLKSVDISGTGDLDEGLAFALQMLVNEMRKIGGKIQRIFIITDGKIEEERPKLQKMVDVAQGLGIFIDICQIGKRLHYQENFLKVISQKTKGEYGYFNNSKALINAGKSFASKKNVKRSSDYLAQEEEKGKAPLVDDIAVELRRPTLSEMKLMASGKGQEKCQICHSIKNPINNADFYASGRYCPSCGRPYHLHCAALWAKKSDYGESIFRCPFCYFLLKVPLSIMKMVENVESETEGIKILDDFNGKTTKMVKISSSKVDDIDESCSYCRNIFIGDYEVFRCQNCGAYYHEPCLNKMYNENKSCRNCGAIIE